MYATVADLREEGVTASTASDARLARLLDEATATIDRVTGSFFEPRPKTFRVSGRGAPTVELPVPPITVTRVEAEYEGYAAEPTVLFPLVPWSAVNVPLSEATLVVRGAPVGPDFDGARLTLRHGLRFPRGHANIVVDGIWGFTEADGSPQGRTPLAVHRAAMLLVLRNIAPLGNDDAFEARSRWRVVEERTRDQSYRLDPLRSRAPMLTGDPEVDLLLAPYVRPSSFGAA